MHRLFDPREYSRVGPIRTTKCRSSTIYNAFDFTTRFNLRALDRVREREREALIMAKQLLPVVLDHPARPIQTYVPKDLSKLRRRRRRRHTVSSGSDVVNVDMDIDFSDEAASLPPPPRTPVSELPCNPDGTWNLDVPWSVERWRAFKDTPLPGVIDLPSTSSRHSSPCRPLRSSSTVDNNKSQHAPNPSVTPTRPILRINTRGASTSPVEATSSRVVASSGENGTATGHASASRLTAEEKGKWKTTPTVLVVHADEDYDDNASELSSTPPSPGKPEEAREIERQYREMQSAVDVDEDEDEEDGDYVPHRISAIPSPDLSNMSFTLDPLPSPPPTLPQVTTTSVQPSPNRPSIRIDTTEATLFPARNPAPFTAYPIEPGNRLGLTVEAANGSAQASTSAASYSATMYSAAPMPGGYAITPASRSYTNSSAAIVPSKHEPQDINQVIERRLSFIRDSARFGAMIDPVTLDPQSLPSFPMVNGAINLAVVDLRRIMGVFGESAIQGFFAGLKQYMAPLPLPLQSRWQ